MADEHDLLDRWRGGDRQAGDALFGLHFAALFRFFRAKLEDPIAEDLTQATFLACVKGRDDFRGEASFRTYLFAVARKQLLMHFRGRARADKLIELDSVSVADLAASPSTAVRIGDEQRLVREVLRRIPVDFQIAVELYYWEGMSTPEIARVLEIAEGTVRSRLTRARAQLAEMIREHAESDELASRTNDGFERVMGELAGASRSE